MADEADVKKAEETKKEEEVKDSKEDAGKGESK